MYLRSSSMSRTLAKRLLHAFSFRLSSFIWLFKLIIFSIFILFMFIFFIFVICRELISCSCLNVKIFNVQTFKCWKFQDPPCCSNAQIFRYSNVENFKTYLYLVVHVQLFKCSKFQDLPCCSCSNIQIFKCWKIPRPTLLFMLIVFLVIFLPGLLILRNQGNHCKNTDFT